ncbi:ABC transporter substrate-binding protein [Seleniivibrio sp.]|uniref:ABC transporter substrate-binding protein n=1 Tax=Seleniivibrio sp. TaxID=2898801 RepID=UPI0025E70D46|nr:ABC transporter substrate-binding protein [Seleniivibrio sp.]MCD8553609.1 ABC transporter substrate-binding protein [Seleniivibrio sp.]
MNKFIIAAVLPLIILIAGCTKTHTKKKDTVQTKTIVDDTGKSITVKADVQRIVILHAMYLEYFFALGKPPVASTGASAGNAVDVINAAETLEPYRNTADIIDLGSAREINAEAVLAANPDVIVTFKGHAGRVYDRLVQIAPVVQIDFYAPWQHQTRLCAQVAGREAFAEQFIKETEDVIASAAEKLSAHKDRTFAMFRTDGKTLVTRADKDYYALFGLSKPKGYPDEYSPVSIESVAEMNPDYIVFQDSTARSDAYASFLGSMSVWRSLDAVKNGRVFYFDDSFNSFGPLALRLTAENLLKVYSR